MTSIHSVANARLGNDAKISTPVLGSGPFSVRGGQLTNCYQYLTPYHFTSLGVLHKLRLYQGIERHVGCGRRTSGLLT